MVTVRLSGGLGNQLFQYAVAMLLAGENDEIRIEYQSKTANDHSERELVIEKFQIPSNYSVVDFEQYNTEHFIISKLFKFAHKAESFLLRGDDEGKRISSRVLFKFYNMLGYCIQDKHRYYMPTAGKNQFVYGMWHSPIYSDTIKKRILDAYRIKSELLDEKILDTIQKVQNCNSVCVHVRRGDYTKVAGFSTCSKQYYDNAIQYMRSKLNAPTFFVFSDEIDWCKDNIKGEDIIYMEEGNKDYEDFELMRNCKNYIISNSTFSWWAAYLGYDKNKTVITPLTWFDESPKTWMNLPGWVEIER